jgi:hypothetical protein
MINANLSHLQIEILNSGASIPLVQQVLLRVIYQSIFHKLVVVYRWRKIYLTGAIGPNFFFFYENTPPPPRRKEEYHRYHLGGEYENGEEKKAENVK